ncbi:MAG TPA: P1 family peptidase [Thermomicrobiales bacterium]|nr:P1 family peptidase [Thermomicrobiales bacterium]
MANLSNDDAQLVPRTVSAGRALEFDFPALLVGVAEYDEGPTGCTVFYFPDGAAAAADIRGGSAGTILTQQLLAGDGAVDAICLAGGSIYGLEAATGVAAELFAQHEYSTNWRDIALVAGAIIFDYGQRANANAIYPDKALGRAALRAARSGWFPLGAHGAGCSATVGNGFDYDRGEPSGQGGAFRQVGPTKVAVFTVVNALGAIVDRQGRVVRGHLDPATGARDHLAADLERRLAGAGGTALPFGNTTLTVVATNQRLGARSLRQLARQVHGSLARAIQPFHLLEDGDTLYALTTNEVDNPVLGDTALGVIASELAWDAVLSSVPDGAA